MLHAWPHTRVFFSLSFITDSSPVSFETSSFPPLRSTIKFQLSTGLNLFKFTSLPSSLLIIEPLHSFIITTSPLLTLIIIYLPLLTVGPPSLSSLAARHHCQACHYSHHSSNFLLATIVAVPLPTYWYQRYTINPPTIPSLALKH